MIIMGMYHRKSKFSNVQIFHHPIGWADGYVSETWWHHLFPGRGSVQEHCPAQSEAVPLTTTERGSGWEGQLHRGPICGCWKGLFFSSPLNQSLDLSVSLFFPPPPPPLFFLSPSLYLSPSPPSFPLFFLSLPPFLSLSPSFSLPHTQ